MAAKKALYEALTLAAPSYESKQMLERLVGEFEFACEKYYDEIKGDVK